MANNEATLLVRIKQAGGEALGSISDGIKKISSTVAAAGVAIAGFAAAGISAFRVQELATNQLSQSMVQQGVFSTELRQKYLDQASALQSLTTFGDEQIISAQAALQAYVGQREVTEELTKATLDFAAAKGIDLKTAADLVGKTIGSSTNALTRYGIEMESGLSSTEKMSAVIDGINSKFGGQAEAVAANLGSLSQLKNTLGDVLEVIGERLAPFISFFTKQLSQFSLELQKNTDFVSGLDAGIKFLSQSFVILKNGILGTVEVISTGLAAAVESVTLVTQGEFSRAKEVAALGMDEIKATVLERKALMDEELSAIDEQKALTEEAKRIQDLELLKQSESNKTQVAIDEAKKRADVAKKAKDDEFKLQQEKLKAENTFNQAKANIVSASANLITELTGSGSKAAFLAQKAAALAQAIVATNVASAQALAVPPAPNLPLAGLAQAAGNINIAAIAASTIKGLATGGIVSATNGGTPFILGEGGRDEAVIPLDDPDAQSRLGGGGVTINFNGPIMGNESQAMELARAIDKSLLKLRQSNQSVAFEEDIF